MKGVTPDIIYRENVENQILISLYPLILTNCPSSILMGFRYIIEHKKILDSYFSY